MKSDNARAYLAVIVLILLTLMIAGLFFVKAPSDNKDLINIALGFTAGFCGSVIGYYFGDSDRNKKDEAQTDAATGKSGDPVHIESEDKL